MAYERVTVINPRTQTAEVFESRISRRGLAEWVADRDALAAAGFPDRPPDVDTPHLRQWVEHPGEQDLPFFVQLREDGEPEGFPAITVRWHAGEVLDISHGLYWVDDHWVMAVAAAGTAAEQLHWPDYAVRTDDGIIADRAFHGATDEEVWETYELGLAAFNECHAWEDGAVVTTYLEYAAFEQEVALAKADIARGFANPMGAVHD